jgi:hypothetical protein
VAGLAAVAVALAAGSEARAAAAPAGRAYAPAPGRAFHGVSGTTGRARDFHQFQRQVGAHPAVLQDYFPWGTSLRRALALWHRTVTRGMLSLSTRGGDGSEVIRPGQIARGRGDRYILAVNRSVAAAHQILYIRLFAEMNAHWNPYSAYNADGSARGNGHSTKSFRRAWRRFAIIVRGGTVASIDRRLRALGMPRLLRAGANASPVHRSVGLAEKVPRARVAMVWNPQTIPNPDIAANQPQRYWPGRRYVDWIGADIYSKFATPGVRAALSGFYQRYRGFPFEIGEYSPWDADPKGRFTRWLFRWSQRRSRSRMLVYYRSTSTDSVYDINHYDAARRALRRILDERRWISYPSGTRHPRPHRRRAREASPSPRRGRG